jgi:hypothetical protein
VVVCHHDGGHARFLSKLRRLFHRLHLHVTIDYVGLKRTHPHYPMHWEVSVRGYCSPCFSHQGYLRCGERRCC